MKINLIIERLCSYYQVDKKKDLANILGVSPTVISNWIARNNADWQIIFTKCEGINLNWLIFGEEEIKPTGYNDSTYIYKDLLQKKECEIRELNREVGKLEAMIELLKKENKDISLHMAAEPELKYKKK